MIIYWAKTYKTFIIKEADLERHKKGIYMFMFCCQNVEHNHKVEIANNFFENTGMTEREQNYIVSTSIKYI
jgi:hypothetical protein